MDKFTLHCGDCLDVFARLEECSIDSCVTDPPYHLVSIVKRFSSPTAKPVRVGDINATNDLKAAYARSAAGFMGKQWDGGDIAFRPETWAAVFRVLKPGAHLLAFGGTRTYHRMACAIEDAGFEIRDCVQWLYGSGFPKSHNIGNGWGTALKPACELIVLARKPLSEKTVAANVLRWGTGAINVGACRVPGIVNSNPLVRNARGFQSNGLVQGEIEGGGLTSEGRWPANVIHDGSEEVVREFPDVHGGGAAREKSVTSEYNASSYHAPVERQMNRFGDSGSAARFFYCAKASKKDRAGSKHPTVKPVKLIRYLCRLITPPGGIVLDPFAGTGTTGEAAALEGMRSVLIEREQEYQTDIRRRLEWSAMWSLPFDFSQEPTNAG